MPCHFCDSNAHLTEYCDIYDGDESRQKIAADKNLCKLCLNDDHRVICHQPRKCFICFGTGHINVFCPRRNKAPKLFLPSIDANLISRFLQVLNADEEYSLAFSSQRSLSFSTQKPVKVKKIVTRNDINKTYVSVAIISLELMNIDLTEKSWLLSKSIICKAKKVKIHSTTISAPEFLCFLSSLLVTELDCTNMKLSNEVDFAQVLALIPNIEHLRIEGSDIKFGNSWPESLLEYENAKLKSLEITVKNYKFSFRKLSKFLKKKSDSEMKMILTIFIDSRSDTKWIQALEKIRKKIFKKFVITNTNTPGPQLIVFAENADQIKRMKYLGIHTFKS